MKLDAAHFRQQAARSREMAQSGEDILLSRMLLDVAMDLDAEAEAIEAQSASERRGFRRQRLPDIGSIHTDSVEIDGAILHMGHAYTDQMAVQIIDLSVGGAKIRIPPMQTPGSKVTLEIPSLTLRLDATIVRVLETETAMAFDPCSKADPCLNRLLQAETKAVLMAV